MPALFFFGKPAACQQSCNLEGEEGDVRVWGMIIIGHLRVNKMKLNMDIVRLVV